MDKITILYLAANPADTDKLALDEEIREITAKIRAADYRDSIELISAWAVRPDDLLQLLNQHKPEIVHFSGHGNSSGEIILKKATGTRKTISCKAINRLFSSLKNNIKIILLNYPNSNFQAKELSSVIDYTIGMDGNIGDDAAITFSASFYRAIGFGRSIEESFKQGLTALDLEGFIEKNSPQLFVHKEADQYNVIIPIDFNSKIRKKYNDNLKTKYGQIEFAGMSIIDQEAAVNIPIESIYIPLNATSYESEEKGCISYSNPIHLLKRGEKSVILGDPGSGKSTLIRFLSLIGIYPPLQERYKSAPDNRLPIVILLRRYADALKSTKGSLSLKDYIDKYIPIEFNLDNLKSEFFSTYLELGHAILLFDGLDELPDVILKKEVINQINSLLTSYPGNTAIITSRVTGYSEVRFDASRFKHYHLSKLQMPEIEQFLIDWYRARIKNEKKANEEALKLISIIRDEKNLSILKLAQNPLLLTIIALIHRMTGILPSDRSLLYQKCTETLAINWNKWKANIDGYNRPFSEEKRIMRRLEAVAYWMHLKFASNEANNRSVLNHDELVKFLIGYIGKFEKMEGENRNPVDVAEEFLNFVKERAGLLVEIGNGEYQFIHLIFQEYLAALYIKTFGESKGVKGYWDIIKDRCDDPHWHEVIRLFMALLEAEDTKNELVKKIFKIQRKRHSEETSLLLGGFILDNIISANLYKEVVFNDLLRSVIRSKNYAQFRHIVSVIQDCLERDNRSENEEMLTRAALSLWEGADPIINKKLLLALMAARRKWSANVADNLDLGFPHRELMRAIFDKTTQFDKVLYHVNELLYPIREYDPIDILDFFNYLMETYKEYGDTSEIVNIALSHVIANKIEHLPGRDFSLLMELTRIDREDLIFKNYAANETLTNLIDLGFISNDGITERPLLLHLKNPTLGKFISKYTNRLKDFKYSNLEEISKDGLEDLFQLQRHSESFILIRPAIKDKMLIALDYCKEYMISSLPFIDVPDREFGGMNTVIEILNAAENGKLKECSDKAIELSNNYPDIYQEFVLAVHAYAGLESLYLRQTQDAISYLDRYKESGGSKSWYNIKKSLVLLYMRNLDAAEKILVDQINESNYPDEIRIKAYALFYQGIICRIKMDFAKAKECYINALDCFRKIGDKYHEGLTIANLGIAYRMLGDFEMAKTKYKEAIQIFEGKDEYRLACVTARLGTVERLLGDFISSTKCYNASLNIFSKYYDNIRIGIVNRELAINYMVTGDSTNAIYYNEEALKNFESANDNSNEGQSRKAIALYNLGLNFLMIGKWEESSKLFSRSFDTFLSLRSWYDIVLALISSAFAYRMMDMYGESLDDYKDALSCMHLMRNEILRDFSKDRFQNNNSDYINEKYRSLEGMIIGKIGDIYRLMNLYDDAISNYEIALNVIDNLKDVSDLEELRSGRILGDLGIVYRKKNMLEKSIDHFERALEIFQRLGNKSQISSILEGLGEAFLSKGLYKNAIEQYRDSLRTLREDKGDITGENLINLGEVFVMEGRYRRAIHRYKAALIYTNNLGKQALEARTYRSMGIAQKNIGEIENARDNLEKSLAIALEIKDIDQQGKTLCHLGLTYETDHDKAIKYIIAGLDKFKIIKDLFNQGWAYGQIGKIYMINHRWKDAIQEYDNAIKLNPHDISAHIALGLCYKQLNSEKYNEHVIDYNMKFSSERNIAESLINSTGGISEYEQARFEATFGAQDRAIEFVDVAMNRGQVNEGKIIRDPLLQSINHESGFKALLHKFRGKDLCSKRDYGKAIVEFQNALGVLELASNIKDNTQDRKQQGIIKCYLGLANYKKGSKGFYNKSIKLIEDAINIFKTIPDGILTSWALKQLGLIHLHQESLITNDLDNNPDQNKQEILRKAIRALEEAILLTPESGQIHLILAICYKDFRLINNSMDKYVDECQIAHRQIKSRYIFNWNEIPGTDERMLKEYLIREFGINWIIDAKIEKSYKDTVLRMHNKDDSILLTLYREKSEMVLRINDVKADKFIAKEEKNELNIYKINRVREYDKACLEAVCGNSEKALEFLDIALKRGQTGTEYAEKDPHLKFLRNDLQYKYQFSRIINKYQNIDVFEMVPW